MSSYFDAEFFQNNRNKLRQLHHGNSPIVLAAHGLMQRNSDTTFPFRQDSNFWYLTGIEEPDIILVMDKDQEYLIVPGRETTREAFDGKIDTGNLQTTSGIKQILLEAEGWKKLDATLKESKEVATCAPPPAYVDVLGIYTNPARQRLVSRMKSCNESLEIIDLRNNLTKLRIRKQQPELAAMQQAIDITIDTLQQVKKYGLLGYKTEYELEAAITSSFRKRKAGHGYMPIVACGQNACTLHYIRNNDQLTKSELILLDVGAEVDNYSADISRTYSLGEPTKRQIAIHAAVLEVQKYALGLLKPGIIIKQYEKKIEQFMGERLQSLGLIKLLDRDEIRRYYPHATSHFLGLDVHDVGDYENPLEPGMVLTVEPGIYIPDEGIGIRIEDNVLITKDGLKVLTEALPKSLS